MRYGTCFCGQDISSEPCSDHPEEPAEKEATWATSAWKAVLLLALHKQEFTTDDVWTLLESQRTPSPAEPRVMGPLMSKATNAGVCVRTDRVRRSIRSQCHGRPIAIYRSLRVVESDAGRITSNPERASFFAPKTGLMRKDRKVQPVSPNTARIRAQQQDEPPYHWDDEQ